MSRSSKLITALLMIIFCFSLFTITAVAVGEEGEIPGGDSDVVVPSEAQPVYTDPIVEPVYTDPIVEPVYTDPIYTEAPVDDEPSYVEPDVETPTYNYNNNYDDNSYDYDNSQSSYISGEQSDDNGNSSSASALYDSNHKIDDTELSSNDWKDIAANLSDTSNLSSDGDDFSFIQKNTDKGDNGYLILWGGIFCLLLSASGIIYLISSAVIRRKRFATGYSGNSSSGRYRSDDDYDDGYKSAKNEQKRIDRSRKFDTADVKLPKSGTRYKNGGKRYK